MNFICGCFTNTHVHATDNFSYTDRRFVASVLNPANFQKSELSKITKDLLISAICAPYLDARDLSCFARTCATAREMVGEVKTKHVWRSRVVTAQELLEYVCFPKYVVTAKEKAVPLNPEGCHYISKRYRKRADWRVVHKARYDYWEYIKHQFEELCKTNRFIAEMVGLKTLSAPRLSMHEVRILTDYCKQLRTLDLYGVPCCKGDHSDHEEVIKNCKLVSFTSGHDDCWGEDFIKLFSKQSQEIQYLDLSLRYSHLSGRRFSGISDRLVDLTRSLPNLVELNLARSCFPEDKILKALGENCRNLRVLNVSYALISATDEGICALAAGCPQLEVLILTYCWYITDRALEALAVHSFNLRHLDLSSCMGVRDRGIIAIAKKCKRLEKIEFYGSKLITDAAVMALVKHCPELRELRLQECEKITDSVYVELAKYSKRVKCFPLPRPKEPRKGLLACFR